MNFDDLSARWQQQASPAAPFPGPDSLNSLLTSQGPVAKMRRNAWADIGASLLAGLLVLAGLRLFHSPYLGVLLALLLPLYGGLAYCYVRTLRVLHALRHASSAPAAHIARQLMQLRQLVRLYYASTMLAALVVVGLAGYAAIGWVLPALPAASTGRFLTWLILTVLISVLLTHWITRRYLRHAYGQHLDHLESVLHELREEAADAPEDLLQGNS